MCLVLLFSSLHFCFQFSTVPNFGYDEWFFRFLKKNSELHITSNYVLKSCKVVVCKSSNSKRGFSLAKLTFIEHNKEKKMMRKLLSNIFFNFLECPIRVFRF